jgi:hypothetical protein
MKSSILLFVIGAAALSSCTTAYKTGQTPDDVYYSPVPPREEYVRTEKEDDRQYRYDEEYYDDRYLRMKVANRYRWNDLSDWYYYERYGFGYNYIYGSFNNPFNSWNYFYNPYCNCCHTTIRYTDPKTLRPAVIKNNFNLAGYNNTQHNNNNNGSVKSNGKSNTTRTIFNNSNTNNSNSSNGKGLSNTIRTIFSGNENNNSGGSGRTYNPSNSSSSSSSSSGGSKSSGGGGGGGVSRPTRN